MSRITFRWEHYPTKSVAFWPNGSKAANVGINNADYKSPIRVEVFSAAGKRIHVRGAEDIQDGVGVATALLAAEGGSP